MKRELIPIHKNQLEMKNVIAVIKNTVEGFNNRLEEAEDQISDLKDRVEKAPIQSSK